MLIGLAVGVDYAMFYLRRMMEEQDKGRSPEAALDIAAATSGRAVLISGFTVMAAMAGMFFSGNPIFSSFGIGTILVVGVAMVGSLTFLPAVLSYLGQKGWLEKGRVPYIAKRRHKAKGESRMWNAILNRVLARPLISAVLAGGLLVALTIPALGMQFKEPGTEGMSRSQPIIQTLDRVDAAFPGGSAPGQRRDQGEGRHRPRGAVGHHSSCTTRRSPRASCRSPRASTSARTRRSPCVSLAVQGKGTDAASNESVRVLREEVVPATVGKLADAEVAVTGMTAQSKDFLDTMKSHLPIVFLFVLSLAFILLLVTFRSIVIPIKAIILNLLSVGAAYGILTLVFQDGHGEKPLDFTSVGGITPGSRCSCSWSCSASRWTTTCSSSAGSRSSWTAGCRRTTRSPRASSPRPASSPAPPRSWSSRSAPSRPGSDQQMKQLGIGLAAAILIDATVVRAVLLPATMKLLGSRNWYLPKRLGWLPKFEHEQEVRPRLIGATPPLDPRRPPSGGRRRAVG